MLHLFKGKGKKVNYLPDRRSVQPNAWWNLIGSGPRIQIFFNFPKTICLQLKKTTTIWHLRNEKLTIKLLAKKKKPNKHNCLTSKHVEIRVDIAAFWYGSKVATDIAGCGCDDSCSQGHPWTRFASGDKEKVYQGGIEGSNATYRGK